MIKGLFLGFFGLCLAIGMILVAVMPQTLSNVYYGIVQNGLQFSPVTPAVAFHLSQPMPVEIDIANTATSDRIYRKCPSGYPARPDVSRQDMTEIPLNEDSKVYFDKGPDRNACQDMTIHAGQHQSVSIDLNDLFDLRDPGNYYFSLGTAEDGQRLQVPFRVIP